MSEKLQGIIVPAVTPFNESMEFDRDMFTYNIEKWNKTDVRGYMVLGSNGEFRSLDDDESLEVIRAVSEAKSVDKTLIVGCGRESLKHTLAFIDKVQDLNANIDYLSAITPSYFGKLMDDDALYDYFKAIADHSRIPILLYCAPSFVNGVCISTKLLCKLADHENIHGIKDTSTNMMADYMLAVAGKKSFSVVAGSINTLMTCLIMGGKGGVVSAANYLPEACAKLVKLFEEGGPQASLDYYKSLQAVAKATGAKGSVAGVKACMKIAGFKPGSPRLPVKPYVFDDEKAIKQLMESV